jgi:hypothetical protein
MAHQYDLHRIGFQYYPDTLHYRDPDLFKWLPILKELGASWVTLVAPVERAIPENFLKGMLGSGIKPILHFPAQINHTGLGEVRSILETYASWGVQYVCFFDRPNLRASWPAAAWAQNNLVERFIDIYLPTAEAALTAGLIPIFPPLEPGGDYWDTAFLQAAIQSIQRRGAKDLLDKLVLGAYAWTGNRSLNWGAGGPERWPGAIPYQTKTGSEDHLGFRIFDWYLALSKAILGKSCPVILMGAGSRLGDRLLPENLIIDAPIHAKINLSIAQLMSANAAEHLPVGTEPVSSNVLACNFWLLTATADSPHISQAWFLPDGSTLPAAEQLRKWVTSQNPPQSKSKPLDNLFHPVPNTKPIQHYLLLPSFSWGISGWHFELIQPFVQKYQPTIGFSINEATYASRVTILGNLSSFPAKTLDTLLNSGCVVEHIEGDGTELASNLSAKYLSPK